MDRLALEAQGKITKEAVQSDMGWVSFEVIEAQNEIRFEGTLRNKVLIAPYIRVR